MIKIFFVDESFSELADSQSVMLQRVKEVLLKQDLVKQVMSPEVADIVLLQEKVSFKDFRYIHKLFRDPIISKYTDKVFTINCDDCATGLLRGLYTSLPKSRFDFRIHRAIPYMQYPNELIFGSTCSDTEPEYLASWRGNTKSNAIRLKMISLFNSQTGFRLEATNSWLNHQDDEKQSYRDLILNSKFSLCPAGWAPVSFRIYESMALGRCPVILADEFVPPPGPDWNSFALFYPQRKITELEPFLRHHESMYDELGAKALQAWQTYFEHNRVETYFANSLIKLVASVPFTTQALEFKRWRSFSSYWNNNWTLPQRVINRARKWSRNFNTKLERIAQ